MTYEWASLDSVTRASILNCLEQFGIQPTEDNGRQMLVFLEAVETYDVRSAAYGQVWQNYGALSNLLSVARKADRLMKVWWHNLRDDGAPAIDHKDGLDDAVDLLNYTAFMIRNVRHGNLTGEAGEPLRCTKCGWLATRCRCSDGPTLPPAA